MAKKDIVCIVCPMGCRLTVEKDESNELGYIVSGNKCKRGEDYGIKEMTNPTRVITSTVKIKNGLLPRIPVKTDGAVPKELIFDCMKVINEVELVAPVKVGDVVIENILDTGINIVTSRSMECNICEDTVVVNISELKVSSM